MRRLTAELKKLVPPPGKRLPALGLIVSAAVLAILTNNYVLPLLASDPPKDSIPRFSPVVQEFTLLGESRPQDAGGHEAEFRAADYESIGYQSTEIGGISYQGTLWRTTDQGHPYNMRTAMFLMKDGVPVVLVGTWDGDVRCTVPAYYAWVDIEDAASIYRMLNIHDMQSVFPAVHTVSIGGKGDFSFTCDR
ncbi:MAG TPA: hypothetical protein VM581_05330 [Magnetospirillaceae bacterium]|nr:hypothetical protein [Magnetospirillaceae bacterium]